MDHVLASLGHQLHQIPPDDSLITAEYHYHLVLAASFLDYFIHSVEQALPFIVPAGHDIMLFANGLLQGILCKDVGVVSVTIGLHSYWHYSDVFCR